MEKSGFGILLLVVGMVVFSLGVFFLALEYEQRRTNVIAKQVNILGISFNQAFSIKPEESNYPTRSQGIITLTNVGWIEGFEYEIRIISSHGAVCGAITKTA